MSKLRNKNPEHVKNKTARFITDHVVTGADQNLTILAVDAPGTGGASHLYQIEGFDIASNNAITGHPPRNPWTTINILFQNGPIPEVGVNGITNEALLAIVADRLRGFQSGLYPCEENAAALRNIDIALDALMCRTCERMRRGVEGKYVV